MNGLNASDWNQMAGQRLPSTAVPFRAGIKNTLCISDLEGFFLDISLSHTPALDGGRQ